MPKPQFNVTLEIFGKKSEFLVEAVSEIAAKGKVTGILLQNSTVSAERLAPLEHMATVFRLLSEWDIGEADIMFASKTSVQKFLMTNKPLRDLAKEAHKTIGEYIEELKEEGYLLIEEVPLFQ